MSPPAFSIEAAVRFGWDAARKNLKVFAPLVLIGFFINALRSALLTPSGAYAASGPNAVHALLWLVLQLATVVLTMGWIRIALKVHDGKPATLGELFRVFPTLFSYLLASLVYGLVVAIGMLLLVVPGFIWLAQFGLFGFVVMDAQVDPIEALKRSSALTRGARARLLLLGLVLVGINILGALALLIGLFVTLPLSFLAAAYVYRQLVARAPSGVTTTPPEELPKGIPTPA